MAKITLTTDVGTIAQAGDDLVKLVSGILQEREPIRHARVMNRLIDTLVIKCKKTGIAPEVEVKATCSQLTTEVQQEITSAITDELKPEPVDPAQLDFFSNQTNTTMSTTTNTAPNSNAVMDLITKLAAVLQRLSLIFEGAKATAFQQAAITGVSSVPLSQPVTAGNLVTTLFATLQKSAAISGNKFFIKLSVIAQCLYNDIETKSRLLPGLISDFIRAEKTIKTLKDTADTETKTPDPNLNADELALAKLFGTLVAQVAIFFGKAQAAQYISAFTSGVNSQTATSTNDKLLVDAVFGASKDLAILLKRTNLLNALIVANNVYDDFSGGDVTVFNLKARIDGELTKLKAAA